MPPARPARDLALRRRPWARDGHLIVGFALVAWIVVQIAILGLPVHPLQGIHLAWGWILVALAVRLRWPGRAVSPGRPRKPMTTAP